MCEHKFFPWLQTFITRKQRGIQTGAHVEVYWCVVYKTNLLNWVIFWKEIIIYSK